MVWNVICHGDRRNFGDGGGSSKEDDGDNKDGEDAHDNLDTFWEHSEGRGHCPTKHRMLDGHDVQRDVGMSFSLLPNAATELEQSHVWKRWRLLKE